MKWRICSAIILNRKVCVAHGCAKSEIRMTDFGYINRNFSELKSEISKLEDQHQRKITLVAVTKSGTDEELLALAEAGVTDIGENRPQELKRRGDLLRSHGYFPRLHEIGNLQRNKVKLVIEDAHLIHSVDSISLAEEISKQATRLGITANVLIEINSAKEESKGGFAPDEALDILPKIKALPSLSVRGIMTMGPVVADPEEIRPYFRLTKSIFDAAVSAGSFDGEGILSMGMSDSYRVAIEEGSTLVRVGRKLFSR